MKKGLTKLLALMLALLMITAVVVGCGGKADPVDEPDDQGQDPADDENGDETEGPEEPEVPKMDLGGEKTIFACWWDNNPQLGTPMADRTLELNEKYNTSIIWENVAANEYLQKFTAGVLSGSPESHVTYMRSNWMPSCMRKGMCYDLTPWVDFTHNINETSTRQGGMLNGKVYGVVFANNRHTPPGVLLFNKNLAEREGIPNLYDMVWNKTWTWDKYLEYCLKVTKDTDGDGEIDQWGATGANPMDLIFNNGGKMLNEDTENVTLAFDSPEAIEALEFYQDLCIDHKIFGGGRDGFIAGKVLFMPCATYQLTGVKESMVDHYGVIYTPLGPRGTEYRTPGDEIIVITIPASDTKALEHFSIAKELMEPFPRPEGEPEPPLTARYEAQTFDAESCEIMLDMELNAFVLNNYLAWDGWIDLVWDIFGRISRGEETPSAAIEAVKDELQAGIDAVLSM